MPSRRRNAVIKTPHHEEVYDPPISASVSLVREFHRGDALRQTIVGGALEYPDQDIELRLDGQ